MDFNMYLPTIGPIATPPNLARVARGVERMGYVTAKMGEHLVYPRQMMTATPYHGDGKLPFEVSDVKLETLTTFAFLAGQTTTLRFASSVYILPGHSIFDTAMRVATLDYLSGGRLTLGVGTGWMKDEYDVVGVGWEERGEVMDECLGVLRALFEGDGTFKGRHFAFPELVVEPKPAQRPFPIHVGGAASKAVLRRAARFGQGWLPLATNAEVAAAVPRLFAMLGEEGRPTDGFQVVGQCRIEQPERRDAALLIDELREAREAGYTGMNVRVGEFKQRSVDALLDDLAWFADNVMAEAAAF
jgi:probable F420-dependent oxidoreductase